MPLAVPLLLSLLAVVSGGADAPADDPLDAFLADHAVRLPSLDWGDVDPQRLAVLDAALEGKRIVMIGETDHFVSERIDSRLVLIRYLASRGFTNVGMEMGVSDARRMDRFVETGDPRHLARVGLYGYDGAQRYDRVDAVSGWTDDRHPAFGAAVRAESRWFLRQLHEMNVRRPAGAPRIRWFGFDLSMRPGCEYEDAFALLALHGDDETVRDVKRRLARVAGETRLEEVRRLFDLVVHLEEVEDALTARLGADGFLELRRCAVDLAEGLRWIDSLSELANRERVDAGLRARERSMCRHLDELLERAAPDEKFVLLGHALHLARASEEIETDRTMWETVGTHLARTRGDELFGIWLLFDHGTHGNLRAATPIRTLPSIPGTIEARLARFGERLLVPLHTGDSNEAPLESAWRVRFMGQPGRAVLGEQADALFFVSAVTASRRR